MNPDEQSLEWRHNNRLICTSLKIIPDTYRLQISTYFTNSGAEIVRAAFGEFDRVSEVLQMTDVNQFYAEKEKANREPPTV